MICDNCNRSCACPRHLHTGEAKVSVGLTLAEIDHLLEMCSDYQLAIRLERARDLLVDSRGQSS